MVILFLLITHQLSLFEFVIYLFIIHINHVCFFIKLKVHNPIYHYSIKLLVQGKASHIQCLLVYLYCRFSLVDV
jgi:hypothetical protein